MATTQASCGQSRASDHQTCRVYIGGVCNEFQNPSRAVEPFGSRGESRNGRLSLAWMNDKLLLLFSPPLRVSRARTRGSCRQPGRAFSRTAAAEVVGLKQRAIFFLAPSRIWLAPGHAGPAAGRASPRRHSAADGMVSRHWAFRSAPSESRDKTRQCGRGPPTCKSLIPSTTTTIEGGHVLRDMGRCESSVGGGSSGIVCTLWSHAA